MQSDAIDAIDDFEEARGSADGMIKTLNGISVLRVKNTGFVSVGSIERIGESGRRDLYVTPAPARMTTRVGIPRVLIGGVPVSAEEPFLKLALTDAEVDQVLRLYGSRVPDWRDLYFVLELIEKEVGSTVDKKGWIGKSDRDLFTHTANSRTALGDLARHGGKRFAAPKKSLTLMEARGLIAAVVERWLHGRDALRT